MKKLSIYILFLFFGIIVCQGQAVKKNGKLKVIGRQLSNKQDKPVQIKGISSHGLYWFPHCFNQSAIKHLAKDWKVDAIRLAMYSQNFVKNRKYNLKQIDDLVDLAEKNGVYCIIDWHVLDPGNPNAMLDDARMFWEYMSKKHAGKKHVLYEICNEPNGVEWDEVKKYANEIIPLIRKNDPETVILVGTPDWSSKLKNAADDPLQFDNIMYSFHFYAKSHKDRPAFIEAIGRIPVFVTEWGTTTYSGDDGIDLESAQQWLDIFNGNNPDRLLISWMNWSFSDKNEDSAILLPGSGIREDWNNLTPSGKWIRDQFKK